MKKLTLRQAEKKIKQYIKEIDEPIIDIVSMCAGMGDEFEDFDDSLYDIWEREGRAFGYFVVTISGKLGKFCSSPDDHEFKKYLVWPGLKVTVEV